MCLVRVPRLGCVSRFVMLLLLLAGAGWGQQAGPIGRTQATQYPPAVFERRFAKDQMAGLESFAGAPAKDLYKDKQFRRLMKGFVPDCMFHYGRDMPLNEAMDRVMDGSKIPVQVRDGRYVMVVGQNGPYLGGRGFLWLDLQEGIGLGGFYFQPTNGEPAPTLAIFSRQVKEPYLVMSQLPPAFAEDLTYWMGAARVPEIETRYFLTGTNKRILLEHDEDFCAGSGGAPDCMQKNANAADVDEVAAYYLDQIHYATNGTAWMIGADQTVWLGVRTSTCGVVLACRIRVTREHTRVIMRRR